MSKESNKSSALVALMNFLYLGGLGVVANYVFETVDQNFLTPQVLGCIETVDKIFLTPAHSNNSQN